MRCRSVAILLFAAVSAACGGTTAPPAATSAAPSGAGLILQPAPANLGCDTIGVPYRSVTFEIDPAATDPVTAVSDEGTTLKTFWSVGFVGGPADDPVVRDPGGQVVAKDGDVLQIPEAAFPRLQGYFVCPSADALYVLLQDPS
jgi:hypothetical protein